MGIWIPAGSSSLARQVPMFGHFGQKALGHTLDAAACLYINTFVLSIHVSSSWARPCAPGTGRRWPDSGRPTEFRPPCPEPWLSRFKALLQLEIHHICLGRYSDYCQATQKRSTGRMLAPRHVLRACYPQTHTRAPTPPIVFAKVP